MRKRGTVLCTALPLIEGSFKLIPLIVSVLCSGQNIRKFSETTGPTEAYHVAGKRWKAYSNDLGYLLLFIIVNHGGWGHLAGILLQIWLRSAGLLAGL